MTTCGLGFGSGCFCFQELNLDHNSMDARPGSISGQQSRVQTSKSCGGSTLLRTCEQGVRVTNEHMQRLRLPLIHVKSIYAGC
jgi:hypothetical protein